MRTVGVDLSADPRKTASATISWAGGEARLEDVTVDVDDEALLRTVGEARWCGEGWIHLPEVSLEALAG